MADHSTFDTLGLEAELLTAVAELGFEHPTPIQQAVIPRLLRGSRDIVGLAQTGTGKTAAYGLPCIQQVDPGGKQTQVLILCPTRELCLQITRDLKAYSRHKPGVHTVAVYGGSSIAGQISALRRGAQIIVATPGRVYDHLRRKSARLDHVDRVILDEADEMLNMGFKEDLEAILKQVPDNAQTLLFSATMPGSVASIAGHFMNDPDEVTIGKRNAGAENVTHVCYTIHSRDRYLALKRVADFYPEFYGIVFCRTRIETQQVADRLVKDGYNADSLHGDLSQIQRDRVMDRFRGRRLQMLVATDVAARGLDVEDLTHIINFNLPDDLEAYTHRSGRTGRAGKAGISVALVPSHEKGKVRRIEQLMKKKFVFRPLPTGQEVCESQLKALIGRVLQSPVDHQQMDPFMPAVEAMLEGMSRTDLIKQFISLEFNRVLDYYRGAPDLNVHETKTPTRRKRYQKAAETGFKTVVLNIGKRDALSPKRLMELINHVTPGRPVEIGRISIRSRYSLVEVEGKDAAKVINSLGHADLVGKEIQAELADENSTRQPGRQRSRPAQPGPGRGPRHARAMNKAKKRKFGKPGAAKPGAAKSGIARPGSGKPNAEKPSPEKPNLEKSTTGKKGAGEKDKSQPRKWYVMDSKSGK